MISAIYKAKYLIIYRYAKGVEILGNSAIAWIHNKFLKIFVDDILNANKVFKIIDCIYHYHYEN